MHIKYFFTLSSFSFLIVSCQQTKVDLKTEEAAILKTDSTWSALAGELKDIDRIVSYWSDDAVLIPPGEPLIRGKEALHKFVENSKNIPGFHISWRSSDPQFSPDGKMAYMYGENLMSMNDSTGNKISFTGR